MAPVAGTSASSRSGKASADDVAQAGPDDYTTLPLKTRSRVRRFQPGQAKGAVRVGAHRPEQITRIGVRLHRQPDGYI
jgi:hypothetical protein